MKNANQELFVPTLRSEATEVKSCFTQYSIQGIGLAVSVLGATLGAMEKIPSAIYAPLPVIVLLMAICRLGISKYGTANRHYGYELHLARVRHIEAVTKSKSWGNMLRGVGWEEAMRAWRVVQPGIFRRIYKTPQDYPWPVLSRLPLVDFFRWGFYQLQDDARAVVDSFSLPPPGHSQAIAYPWFMPSILVKIAANKHQGKGSYYAGSYLAITIFVLNLAQAMMLLPMTIAIVEQIAYKSQWHLIRYVSHLTVFLLCALAIWVRARRTKRRIEILEDGLLSIHSCSIVWQAVLTCHLLAINGHRDFFYYTDRLAGHASEVASQTFTLHQWLSKYTP